MAKKKGNRDVIVMESTESKHSCHMRKNKRNTPDRLELKRYDPVLRRHVIYKEKK